MKCFLSCLLILVSNLYVGQNNFFNDVGVFSGVSFNRSARLELFQTIEYEDGSHFLHGHNINRQKHFFVDVNTSLYKQQLRRKSAYNSWTFKVRTGLFFTQTQRNINIIHYHISSKDSVDMLIDHVDNLFYIAKSHNIGLSTGIIFQKKWSKHFAMEYGITHRIDYSVATTYDFLREPENDAWRQVPYSKWEVIKTNTNQDLLFTLSPQFFATEKITVGAQVDITTILFQSWYSRQTKLILGEYNNRLNSNLYLGLTVRYGVR